MNQEYCETNEPGWIAFVKFANQVNLNGCIVGPAIVVDGEKLKTLSRKRCHRDNKLSWIKSYANPEPNEYYARML